MPSLYYSAVKLKTVTVSSVSGEELRTCWMGVPTHCLDLCSSVQLISDVYFVQIQTGLVRFTVIGTFIFGNF